MNLMKKRILSVLCAALLVLSTAACGGGKDNAPAGGDSADAGQPAAPASAMSKEDYLASVDGLTDGMTAFAAASAEFVSAGLTNAEDTDALNASIEKIRETKQVFIDFSAIANPAEGYEDTHTALVTNCGEFADLVDEYCDILAGAMSGQDTTSNTDIQTRMEAVVTALGESIATAQADG